MHWDRVSRNREFLSVLFCVAFSISSLVWNSNLLVRGIASLQAVGTFFSGSLDNFGSVFKSVYNKNQSYESVRQERDSCLAVMEDYKLLPQDIERITKENQELRSELGFAAKTSYQSVKAEIFSIRLNSIFRTIIIGKGSDDGIKPYMPVIGRSLDRNGQIVQSVVGKVIAVSAKTSIVEPLINSNFKMGVSIPGINFWSILSGNSGRGVEAILNFIDQGIVLDQRVFNPYNGPEVFEEKQSAVTGKIGMEVVSSGSGGIFPKGIPVGVIVEEGVRSGSFKTAYLRPYIEFENLKFVTVILKLPDEWKEQWPVEKNIQIENPFFGKVTFPGEETAPQAKPAVVPKTQPVETNEDEEQ